MSTPKKGYGRHKKYRIVKVSPKGTTTVLATSNSLDAIMAKAQKTAAPAEVQQLELGEVDFDEYMRESPMRPHWKKIYTRNFPLWPSRLPNPETVHNPATRALMPVALITDRAKRYRAQKANEQKERRCIYCGRPGGDLHNEHINGKEADAAPENIAYACRSCNTTKGAHFARLGFGTKTQQYNPTKAGGAANLAEWMEAVGAIRPHKGAKYAGGNYGAGGNMKTAAAVAMIRATPPAKRSEFASMIWGKRYRRGTAAQDEVPF